MRKWRYAARFLARCHIGQAALQVSLPRRALSIVAYRLSIGVKIVISHLAYLQTVTVRD